MNNEKHFDHYIQLNKIYDLHSSNTVKKTDKKKQEEKDKKKQEEKDKKKQEEKDKNPENTIFYGPSGIGKYTQVLKKIKTYSHSELKYEKKMTVTYNKQTYIFKISDIHYEIDMTLLGCNAKILWHEIYHQIIDILSAKQVKMGIILCKNFHDIHNELLDNFYNYMTNLNNQSIHIYYYIITEQMSFIPTNIIKNCKLIPFARPSKSEYKKCIQQNIQSHENNQLEKGGTFDLKKIDRMNLENIQNIKQLYSFVQSDLENENQYKIICNKIIKTIESSSFNQFSFLKFRHLLYELLIYHLNIYECIWYIQCYFIENGKIPEKEVNQLLIKTFTFFQYFNNNYRPIYHLEHYFISIIKMVKGL